MSDCPTCHAAVPSTAVFCPSCGAALARPDPAAATVLPEAPPTLTERGGAPPIASNPRAAPGEAFAPGEVLGKRYRIAGLLGRGGMGAVYRADDLKLGQPVALKFLSPELERDPAALARLHAEVRNARQVSHPYVCRVHDIDEFAGRHFLTMEYVDGEDLASLLHRIGRLPEAKAIEIGRQVASGLHAAHERGVVHRDLKPANVMIDGHGRAKITDFGLAVTAAEGGGELAGTPPYMAPELFAGGAATVRSDLYALGLLLYELFTGRRPFESSSLLEWKRTHESTAPESPGMHVKDLDPVVERLILRCLEKDPARRPGSAAQIALALPGGDPLAAALAAGETPSPEMVAAADAGERLPTGLAWSGLALVAALLVAIAFASRVNDYRWVPIERSAEVLADRATALAEDLGYGPTPPGRAWGYERDGAFLGWEGDPLPPELRWRRMTKGQPLVYAFWYRQDPLPVEPLSFGGGWPDAIRRGDPPLVHAGAVEMTFDPRGRLVRFAGIPPAPSQPDPTRSVDGQAWTRLFAAAGLDPAAFAPADPEWTPPRYADRRLAWRGTHPDHSDIPLRVEAAELAGAVVWFQLVAPWDEPPSALESGLDSSRFTAALLFGGFTLLFLATAVSAARRNLRGGRADRAGAWRLASATALVGACGQLLDQELPLTLSGISTVLYRLAVAGLLSGALVWLSYLALEPYVRRHWPRGLVSWTRLLDGRFRDPLVGRDLLAGVLVGLAIASSFLLSGWAKVWTNSPYRPNFYLIPDTLNGLRFTAAIALGQVVWSIVQVFFLLILLVVLRRAIPRDGAAAVVLWAAWSLLPILFALRSWPAITAVLVVNALLLGVIVRLGVVAGVVASATGWVIQASPVTSNLRAPYAASSWLVLGAIALLTLYAFWIARGREPSRT